MKNIKDMIILHIVTYLFLFVIYPLCFPFDLSWRYFVFAVATIVHGIVFWKGQYNWYQRLVGMIVLWRLASWYSQDGVFGISEGDSFGLDWTSASFDAMVVCVKFFFFQSILVLILKIIRWLKEKKENDANVNG